MSTAASTAKTPKATLPKAIFDVEVKNHELLKLAYNAYLAEARSAEARTKTRGLISGGGKKPWKQKGTGRARTGSTRNPIWRGGGITFGPTGHENYTISLSTKQRRQALRQALSLAAQTKRVTSLANFPVKNGKTSEMAKFLSDNGTDRGALLVTSSKSPELIRAVSNIQGTDVISASHLSAYRVLCANHIFIDADAVKELETRLGVVA